MKFYLPEQFKKTMSKIAVFPGSFDPITLGHQDIITRALPFFDKLYIGVGVNIDKKYMFTLEQRVKWIQQVFKEYKNIEVVGYKGLTVDLCRNVGAKFIIRGLRTSADFEFERIIGQVNKQLYPEIETIYLLSANEYSSLNSSIVRDLLINGGDVSQFVPSRLDIKL